MYQSNTGCSEGEFTGMLDYLNVKDLGTNDTLPWDMQCSYITDGKEVKLVEKNGQYALVQFMNPIEYIPMRSYIVELSELKEKK